MKTETRQRLRDGLRYIGTKIIENPAQTIPYIGVGILGLTQGSLAKSNKPFLGGLCAVSALHLCHSPNPVVSAVSALWLAGLGLEFLGVTIDDTPVGEIKAKINDLNLSIIDTSWDRLTMWVPEDKKEEAERARDEFKEAFLESNVFFDKNRLLDMFLSYIRSLYETPEPGQGSAR